jgi:hypothetical protein
MNECASISVQLCFSLQTPEEDKQTPEEDKQTPEEDKHTFCNILKPVNTPRNIDQDVFIGFSFVKCEVKHG